MKNLGLLLVVLILVSCAPQPTPDLKATETAIAYNVLATLTAQVPTLAPTLVATHTPEPTAASKPTAYPTYTPLPEPTATLAFTDTPIPPTSAQKPTTTPTPVIYVVEVGDTLGAIAKEFGVTVEALQEVNAISDPKRLQIGQELIIPKGGTIARRGTATEVRSTSTSIPPTRTVIPTMDIIPSVQATQTVVGVPESMIFVPAGEFIMGSPGSEGLDNEHPQRTVYLDAFRISKYEVTNRQFSQFIDATGYSTDAEKAGWGWAWTGEDWEQVEGADWRHPRGPGSRIGDKMDHPVVQVSWNDADAYCQWVGKRLPTEAEWEKAARGTDGRIYPWGNSAPDGSKLNYCDVNCEYDWKDSSVDDGYTDTAPVGHYEAGKSAYGAYDMAGNVWEWVADWYDADYYNEAPERNPQGPDSGNYRVLRGGSWFGYQGDARGADRNAGDPDVRISYIGFRVAASASSP